MDRELKFRFITLEYRINGRVRIIGGGGFEMVRYNNITIIGGIGIIGGGAWRNRK